MVRKRRRMNLKTKRWKWKKKRKKMRKMPRNTTWSTSRYVEGASYHSIMKTVHAFAVDTTCFNCVLFVCYLVNVRTVQYSLLLDWFPTLTFYRTGFRGKRGWGWWRRGHGGPVIWHGKYREHGLEGQCQCQFSWTQEQHALFCWWYVI